MTEPAIRQRLRAILAADAAGYSRLMALDEGATVAARDRRMRLRIGVHLRDVIEKHDGTVYGDGVNIAHPVRTYRLGMAEGVGEPPAREAPTKAPAPPPQAFDRCAALRPHER